MENNDLGRLPAIPSAGDLKVWWCPQIPCPAFEVPVRDLREAILLCNALGQYDAFQFENNIKPDYCNAGGLVVFEDGDWVDWHDPDTDEDFEELRRRTNQLDTPND